MSELNGVCHIMHNIHCMNPIHARKQKKINQKICWLCYERVILLVCLVWNSIMRICLLVCLFMENAIAVSVQMLSRISVRNKRDINVFCVFKFGGLFDLPISHLLSGLNGHIFNGFFMVVSAILLGV